MADPNNRVYEYQPGAPLHPGACRWRKYTPHWTRPPTAAANPNVPPLGRHPAILNEDRAKNPTIYARYVPLISNETLQPPPPTLPLRNRLIANFLTPLSRRFGIQEDEGSSIAPRDPRNSHSALTPTEDDLSHHDYQEAWQRYVFEGYSSREVGASCVHFYIAG